MIRLTWTELRIMRILSDGQAHTREELLECIDDKYTSFNNLQAALSIIRGKIRETGYMIICELYKGSIHYRCIQRLVTGLPFLSGSSKEEASKID